MPSWWGKFSSKDVKKKTGKENFFGTLHRLISPNEHKGFIRSRGARRCNDTISELGSHSRAVSRSPSPSNNVSRCQSFCDRPQAQPLPLPRLQNSGIACTPSGINVPIPMLEKCGKPPIPASDHSTSRLDAGDIDNSASVSSNCSIDSDDPADSQLHSPLGNDAENPSRNVPANSSSLLPKDHISSVNRKKSRGTIKLDVPSLNSQNLSTSPKCGVSSTCQSNIQSSRHGAFASAPDSSMSSPSRSPMRLVCPEQVLNTAFWAYSDVNLLGSGQCSSPGSGQTSGHNSMGGDMSGQLFWQHCRGSAECSPIPSPRMTSPGPSSRIHSGAVTPLHPRAGGTAPEPAAAVTGEGKKQSHRLPLPPITISNTSPFSTSNSASGNPSLKPRSPGRPENPTSPGPRWKKGKLIGRGTFGHVYVGFNSESGEMCAMKEVTLFSDDAKSKESAKQLGQEIILLSNLGHPNIVQYYGTETIDDKLYIYLEYVSGGSIHKLLQDYGKFGELAIRSYTHQILSGLAYLHAKNTVHRDIKGANILVDPNGRVKLADFGMAKHITGASCPLSFKGSPYWMAPEVIKNSNGCNLAVDIWSLGCTVLEMATSKPPWSQYEGIAAMFKIGNSKELPNIPDHLSEDGKDFVRRCLQREPSRRPTAAELLHHPFVKNVPNVERPVFGSDTSETVRAPVVSNFKVFKSARNIPSLDLEGLTIQRLKGAKPSQTFSDIHYRNISCPVSPIGSPHLRSRSPQPLSGRMSPSPISSPRTTSGSSSPLTGGNGAIPFKQSKQLPCLYEGYENMLRSTNNLSMNGYSCQDLKFDLFRGGQSGLPLFRDLPVPENNILNPSFRKPGNGDLREPCDGQYVSSDCSQQVLSGHIKSNQFLDLNSGTPHHGRMNGI